MWPRFRLLPVCVCFQVLCLSTSNVISVSDRMFTRSTATAGQLWQVNYFTNVPHMLLCASECEKDEQCMHFFYSMASQECTLANTDSSLPSIATQVYSWTFYAGKIVCAFTYYATVNKCVKISNYRLSSTNARETCQNEGGELLVLDTSASFNFFHNLFQTNYGGKDILVGLRKVSGKFKWYGSEIEAASSMWGNAQPDNSFGHEYCAGMTAWSSHKLNDLQCSQQGNFACEYPVSM